MERQSSRKLGYVVSMMLLLTLVFSGCGMKDKALDKEWWKKLREQYESQVSVDGDQAKVYVEGIRGDASYNASDLVGNQFHFSYYAMNGNYVELNLDPQKEVAHFDLYVREDQGSFYTRGNDMAFSEISSYMEKLIGGEENYEAYNREAWDADPELVKSDLKILYARFLRFWDQAFSEVNPTLKSYGIDFGDAYRDIDATQPTSKEIVIKNEHQFENGFCKDCGMSWTEYMNRTLATLEGKTVKENAVETEWFSDYGQNSPYCGYYVQYSSSETTSTELFLNDGPELSCRVTVKQDDDQNYIHVMFMIEENLESIGNGLLGAKYCFSVQMGASPGDYEKIFSSKEAFKEYGFLDLTFADKDRRLIRGWEEMSDEELDKMLKKDKCKYYTQDEFIDFIWAEHERMLMAIDKGMVWYDTNLEELGLNYK
ncbi:MAG: hypothetical protein IKQ25_10815 [Lachnospiraceae bacterium]|nr:hypothetical protein [Lachnospiraceae bacterium]MBR6151763.1 hypothetical protein [Lachnospiraceae bacterium]